MFTLTQDGEPKAAIQIPAWAAEHEKFAASELHRYVWKISGAEFPVHKGLKSVKTGTVVLADLSCAATRKFLPSGLGDGLRYDGFRIRTVKNRLYIVANEASGLVFGVYEYLRRYCGCGFLDFAPRGETIPKNKTLAHGAIDWLNNPACWYRAMQMGPVAEPPEIFARRLDWMAKNGYSHVLVYYGNSVDTLVDGLFSKRADTDWANYRAWFIPELEKRGIKMCFGHHNFNVLIPPDTYLKARPDFFALVDGKRQFTPQFSWCLSNPDLVETVADRLIALAENNPEVDLLSLWPNDGRAPMCQCAACRKLLRPEDAAVPTPGAPKTSASGDPSRWGRRGDRRKARYYMQFCNQVAERLARVFPEKRLSAIAYVDMVDPPLVDFEVHPNIMVHLAIYWRCSKHRLFDPACDLNRQFASIIDSWLKVLRDPSSLVLTTYEQGMGCWKSLPFPVSELLFDDWARAKELGIGGFKTNAGTQNHGVYLMNYAAQTRVMREETLSYEDFVSGFCATFYGEAAAPMEELHRLWERCMRRARAPHVDPSPGEFLDKIFSAAAIKQSRALCDKALSLTRDPILRWRIERMWTLTEYTEINRAAPTDILVKKYYGKELSGAELKRLHKYVEEEVAFVQPSIDAGDDLFGSSPYALQYLHNKRWLQRVTEKDGKIDLD